MSQTILRSNNTFRIFNDSMTASDRLEAGTYLVDFNPMAGYSLTKVEDICVTEKIYGPHKQTVEDTYDAFECFDRNLGVILSGAKGIGKSLFAKLISQKAIHRGYPIIMVNGYTPDLDRFLDSIEQECVILFDEFEKTFNKEQQEYMLSLFDGVRTTGFKKLFVVTCNDLNQLNDFLVNRPGRFHYHYRFDYPTGDELKEYLQDKIAERYWGEINSVVAFGNRVDLNYDCLRAIAFELNHGRSFGDAIKRLNILNIDYIRYRTVLVMKDGTRWSSNSTISMDFFDYDECTDYQYVSFKNETNGTIELRFTCEDATYDVEAGATIVRKNIAIDGMSYYKPFKDLRQNLRDNKVEMADQDKAISQMKEEFVKNIDHIEFHRSGQQKYHYSGRMF